MVKAIFFDIDGTLVSMKHRKPMPSTVEALKKARENGVKLFINTGRNLYPGKGMAVLDGLLDFDGYVVMNGQRAFMADNSELFAFPIPKDDIKAVIKARENFPFELTIMEKEYVYLTGINKRIESFYNSLHNSGFVCEDITRALEQQVFAIGYFLTAEEEHIVVDNLLHCEAVRWHPLVADLVVKGGGKHTGIERVIEKYGFSPHEVMAIGDGGNDVSMIEYAGIGVAMGNACDQLKAASDYITTDCEDDGIATALKYFSVI